MLLAASVLGASDSLSRRRGRQPGRRVTRLNKGQNMQIPGQDPAGDDAYTPRSLPELEDTLGVHLFLQNLRSAPQANLALALNPKP